MYDNNNQSYLRLKKAGEENYSLMVNKLKPGLWNKIKISVLLRDEYRQA